MNKNIFFRRLVVIFTLASSTSFAANKEELKGLLQELEHVKPVCKRLSESCAICSDGVKRRPLGTGWGDDVAVDTSRADPLLVSDFECAENDESKAAKDGCRVLSDFCKLCPDGKYFYTKTNARIRADLRECATSPRNYSRR